LPKQDRNKTKTRLPGGLSQILITKEPRIKFSWPKTFLRLQKLPVSASTSFWIILNFSHKLETFKTQIAAVTVPQPVILVSKLPHTILLLVAVLSLLFLLIIQVTLTGYACGLNLEVGSKECTYFGISSKASFQKLVGLQEFFGPRSTFLVLKSCRILRKNTDTDNDDNNNNNTSPTEDPIVRKMITTTPMMVPLCRALPIQL
jgi:hypothetical protein